MNLIYEKELQKIFYFPVCNNNEIDRILEVKNAKDYLLRLRANTVVDNMRLYRVYRNYAIINESTDWTFEKSFSSSHYESFISLLDIEDQKKCKELTFGNIFSNEANGMIFKTKYGTIVTISDALRYFLKFSHLALMDFSDIVPWHVKMNSLRIGIRVMLKTETLDFLMDPRGKLPLDISDSIHEPIDGQLEFIAGHEFGHYLLGHLKSDNVIRKHLFNAISETDEAYGDELVYNQSQKDEFEADLYSLRIGERKGGKYKDYFEGALLWFGALELFETVCNLIYPKSPWDYKTHPSARDRYFNLLNNAKIPKELDVDSWKGHIEFIDCLKEFVTNDVNDNVDLYEFYGSLYFDKPDSEWRGRELIDRVDYY